MVAHKLAGSGATFGFEEISVEAKRLEDMVSDVLDRKWPPRQDHLDILERQLVVLEEKCMTVEAQAEELLPEEPPSEEVRPDDATKHKPVIIVSRETDHDVEDLALQLGFFGLSVKTVFSVDAFRSEINEQPEQLAILHANLFDEDDVQPVLEDLRKRYDGSLSYIFMSERSDFGVRLSALRAGGDAYFVLPLDISRVIDTIDDLNAEHDVEPFHVLIVDDDQEQVSYYALILQQAGMITSVASDPRTVLNVLVEAKPELILMDMYMPGCSGTELLTIIRQQEAFVSIPIVFLSVEGDDDRKIAAIRHGGDDFITKPADPEFLIASITNRIQRTRNMRYFMERDSLTGLLNHSNLREQLIREILRAERTGSDLCFAMIDLDRFKQVNDAHGHLTGDKVLKSLSRILQERLRRTDIIGRYGGEEFGVVLLNISTDYAESILNEIRENFSKISHQSEDGEFFVTFSCGIASYPTYKDANELNLAADKALYVAKERGRDRVVIAGRE